jgi:hypothetical protein
LRRESVGAAPEDSNQGSLGRLNWSRDLSFISSVVVGDDIVPRLTVASVHALNAFVAAPQMYAKAKAHAAQKIAARAQDMAALGLDAIAKARSSAAAAASALGIHATERGASIGMAVGLGARAAFMAAATAGGVGVGAAAGAATVAAVATHAALYGSDKTRTVIASSAASVVSAGAKAGAVVASVTGKLAHAGHAAATMGLARAAGSLWGQHHQGPGLYTRMSLTTNGGESSPVTIASAYDAVATIAAPYDAAAETAALEEAAAALVLDANDNEDCAEDLNNDTDSIVSPQYLPNAPCVDGPGRESLALAAALSISEGDTPSYLSAWQRANVSPGQSLCVPGAVYHITRNAAGALGSGSGASFIARRVPTSSMALIIPSRTAISDHAAGDSYCAAIHNL